MHCGRSRYVKVRNKDDISVTTKVGTKHLRYISITLRLKQLFLSEETVKQMMWHHEGKQLLYIIYVFVAVCILYICFRGSPDKKILMFIGSPMNIRATWGRVPGRICHMAVMFVGGTDFLD
jgi:hypothetical protein